MKPSHAFHLAALALCLGASLQVAASDTDLGLQPKPQPQQRTVGAIIDGMQGKFDQSCQKARAAFQAAGPADKDSAAMMQVLHCDCIPKAIAAAFPVDTRASTIAEGAFNARLVGAVDICSAGVVERRIELACDRGIDPFAQRNEPMPAARTQARCRCATSKLAAIAGTDLAQAANDAATDYASQIARHPDAEPSSSQHQQQVLEDIRSTCMAASEPAR